MEAGAAAARVQAETRPGLLRAGRWLLHQSLALYAAVVLLYLLLPIGIILLFSFNDTQLSHYKFLHGIRKAMQNRYFMKFCHHFRAKVSLLD